MAAKRSAPVAAPQSAAGSEALQRLHQGDISLDEYLDIVVERNVQHIVPLVSATRLAAIKDAMREALRTSPDLLQVVKDVTGLEPEPEPEPEPELRSVEDDLA